MRLVSLPTLRKRSKKRTILTFATRPPGTDAYTFVPTVTFDNGWTFPAGQWTPGATSGSDATSPTPSWQWDVPSTTLAKGSGPDPTQYFQYCPITNDDYDNGFDWEMLSDECRAELDPYCNPTVLTGTPLASTVFPSSCLPSVIVAGLTDDGAIPTTTAV